MAKRLTDTDIWKSQRWFRKLHPFDKLAFCYIKDQCSHAGIWKIDCADLMEDVGLEKFDLPIFVENINTEYDKMNGTKIIKERVLLIANSLLWITGFIQFQYEGKDKTVGYISNATKSALWQLYNIRINPSKPLQALESPSEGVALLEYGITKFHLKVKEPLPVFVKGLQALMDKDKDKDNVFKHKKNQNGKFSGNFKAQGEELFANRFKNREPESDTDRKENY